MFTTPNSNFLKSCESMIVLRTDCCCCCHRKSTCIMELRELKAPLNFRQIDTNILTLCQYCDYIKWQNTCKVKRRKRCAMSAQRQQHLLSTCVCMNTSDWLIGSFICLFSLLRIDKIMREQMWSLLMISTWQRDWLRKSLTHHPSAPHPRTTNLSFNDYIAISRLISQRERSREREKECEKREKWSEVTLADDTRDVLWTWEEEKWWPTHGNEAAAKKSSARLMCMFTVVQFIVNIASTG